MGHCLFEQQQKPQLHCNKTPDKSNFKRAGFVLVLVLRLQFIMAWKATLAATEESEEAGYIVSAVRKQRDE